MKKIYTSSKKFLLIALIFIATISNAQLVVDSNRTATQLVNTLLGAGVTVSNITTTGSMNASGEFTEATSNFGINHGIMLTSGNATDAIGPNSFASTGVDNGTPGDPLLDAASGGFTYDASILEFDFTCMSDSVEFRYVFGSEEYNEFVFQGFNDIFGFFISGPGIAGIKNIALVPGTNTPVLIDSINNGYNIGQSTGPCLNCQYYVDNYTGTILQYDGYTTVLTARSAVQPCGTYHMKLALADQTDGVYDSGVFLEAQSFKATGQFHVILDGANAPFNITLCAGECATLVAPEMNNYLWTTGDTTQTITVCEPGNFNVSTTVGACHASSANVFVQQLPALPVPVVTAANDTLFSDITSNSYTYQWYIDSTLIAGATTTEIPYAAIGCYAVEITDSLGCSSISDTVCNLVLGINNFGEKTFVTIKPNPSTGYFTVTTNTQTGNGNLSLTDVSGKIVAQYKWAENENTKRVDASKLSRGIYFLQLKTSQAIIMQKIVIE